MLTIAPPRPPVIICRASCLMPRNTPFRQRSTVKSQSASVMSTIGAGPGGAGHVEGDVDAAEVVDARRNQRRHIGLDGDVADDRHDDGRRARRAGHRVRCTVHVPGGDPSTFGNEPAGDGQADAGGGPGDDRSLVLEAFGHSDPSRSGPPSTLAAVITVHARARRGLGRTPSRGVPFGHVSRERLATTPISWGFVGGGRWGVDLPTDRVLGEMAELGFTAVEAGVRASCPTTSVRPGPCSTSTACGPSPVPRPSSATSRRKPPTPSPPLGSVPPACRRSGRTS